MLLSLIDPRTARSDSAGEPSGIRSSLAVRADESCRLHAISTPLLIVLKQHRGMGGAGVRRIEAADVQLRTQHAESGSAPEVMSPDEFFDRCKLHFPDSGPMVEQLFQHRLAEGMIRVYLSHDTVVGFTHQYPRGLLDPEVA